MSDYWEGKGSDFFGLNDDHLAFDSSPTPGQHFGDWTSLYGYDDPMQYINLSGEDIQQPEYATMEVPSGANEPPLKDQNLSPGQDIQHATTQVQSGANAPPVDDQENSSTESKKRKSAANRNQGTFCIGESSNSKQPEKPTKEPDKYEEPIKDKDVEAIAKPLPNHLNNRKRRANALQNQLRRTYKQLDKSNPLRAKLEKQVEVLKKMVDEIERVQIDIKNILKHPLENESEIEDAKKELIKIEKKSSKFIEDLDKAKRVLSEGIQAKKETKEARQVLEEKEMLVNERSQELKITRNVLNEVREWQEKERNIVPIFANNMFTSVCPPDSQGILETDDPNPQQWTQVPEEDRGQNAEENVNVEVPTEEANGQQLRAFDEQIRGLMFCEPSATCLWG